MSTPPTGKLTNDPRPARHRSACAVRFTEPYLLAVTATSRSGSCSLQPPAESPGHPSLDVYRCLDPLSSTSSLCSRTRSGRVAVSRRWCEMASRLVR